MMVPYRKLLLINLRRPYILLLSIVVMFIMAMWGFSFVPAMFMGESNDPQVFANIELPLGTSIERTEEVISDIERFIRGSLYADKIKHKFTNIERTKNVTDDWGGRSKKLVIKIDPTRAQLAGITNRGIAVSLRV